MIEQDNKPIPGLGEAVVLPGCTGCGLGCLWTLLLGSFAIALGFTQFQVDPSICGGIGGAILVTVTAMVARARRRRPPWGLFLAELAAVAIVIVAFVAWDAPDAVYGNLFGSPRPDSVKIVRAQYNEHPMDPSAWIRFTSSPQDLGNLIQSNQLALQQNAKPEETGRSTHPNWWMPVRLGAKSSLFEKEYYRDGNTSFISSVIGIWVNEQTNEAYGFYIDF